MNHIIVGMLAETFIHPGSGQNVGAIDLPVAREAATDYPFIAGSSLKGALKDRAEQLWGVDSAEVKSIFGIQEDAGKLLVSDARLLLLPVRSLSSAYKWVTCPHLLERLKRDLGRSGGSAALNVPQMVDKTALAQGNGKLFLEERSFEIKGAVDSAIIENLGALIPHTDVRSRLAAQLVIISDNDFTWFAKYALAIQARNALDNKTKTTKPGALWYEETLPPDTLMYTVLAERNSQSSALSKVKDIGGYLQVGGNETVGQGWFTLQWEVAP